MVHESTLTTREGDQPSATMAQEAIDFGEDVTVCAIAAGEQHRQAHWCLPHVVRQERIAERLSLILATLQVAAPLAGVFRVSLCGAAWQLTAMVLSGRGVVTQMVSLEWKGL